MSKACITICAECGEIHNSDGYITCNFCDGKNFIHTNINYADAWQEDDWENKLRREYYVDNPDRNYALEAKRKSGQMCPREARQKEMDDLSKSLAAKGINMNAYTGRTTYSGPKCPSCGSTNLTRISAASKVAKVGMFGILGAGSLGKTYKCSNCGIKF